MVELKDGSVLFVYHEEGAGSNVRARRFRVGLGGLEWLAFGDVRVYRRDPSDVIRWGSGTRTRYMSLLGPSQLNANSTIPPSPSRMPR
jgi:hypothetical protein